MTEMTSEREGAEEWRAGSFTAQSGAGDFEVAGWISGLWALDFRGYDDEDGFVLPGWALTHIPTGYLAAAIMDSLANAQAIVALIDNLGGWDFTDPAKVREKSAAMRQLRDTMPDVLKFRSPTIWPGFWYDRATDDAPTIKDQTHD